MRTKRPLLADRRRCACDSRFTRDPFDAAARCPMCCGACGGVYEMPSDQGCHAPGCPNDGAGRLERWNSSGR